MWRDNSDRSKTEVDLDPLVRGLAANRLDAESAHAYIQDLVDWVEDVEKKTDAAQVTIRGLIDDVHTHITKYPITEALAPPPPAFDPAPLEERMAAIGTAMKEVMQASLYDREKALEDSRKDLELLEIKFAARGEMLEQRFSAAVDIMGEQSKRIADLEAREPIVPVPPPPRPRLWPIYAVLVVLAALVALSLTGCGKHSVAPAAAYEDPELTLKVARYRSWVPQVQDAQGFIETRACDSLLFSGLIGAGGAYVNLTAARDPDGRWHRRPTAYPECYPSESKTTISRDMILGVMWYAFAASDRGMLESLWSYGSARSWIMGDGDRAVVTLTPQMVGLLAQLIYKMGGANHVTERALPAAYPASLTDFEAHLATLEIQLRKRAYGAIESSAKTALVAYAARQPQNPLFQCALGNVVQAASQLKDAKYWPNDRLPESRDRCTFWVTQRDYGADWLPCPAEAQKFSGGELLFIGTALARGWCG